MKLYRVGEVEVSPGHREARMGVEPVRLRPKTFDLLVYMIVNRDRLLSKEELLDRIWEGTTVTENSLMQCVIQLRKALGDDARQPRFIKNVAKTGYRFIGPVEEIDSKDIAELPGREQAASAMTIPSRSHRWRIGLAAAALIMGTLLFALPMIHPPNAAKPGPVAGSWMTDDLEAYRYYSLGVEKAQQMHPTEAIALFEKAIALDPGFAMAHARIGYAYSVSWARTDAGKPYLEKAFRLSGRLSDLNRLYIAAWYAQANDDFEASIRAYRELIARYPEENEPYLLLGNLLVGEDRDEEASDVIQRALKVNPALPQAYNILSAARLGIFKFDEAVAAAQRFVALSPMETNALDSLGLTYEARGDFKDAERTYLAALRMQPNFEIAIVHLGNTLSRMGRYREALEQYERYINVAPSNNEKVRGYDLLALLYRRMGDTLKARSAMEKASELGPNGTAVLFALEQKDLPLADQLLPGLSRLSDRGQRTNQRSRLYLLGERALVGGNRPGAFSYFRQVLATRPPFYNFDWYEECLGDGYVEAGQIDEAIAEYQRVVARYPKLALVWYHLGEAYERKGLLGPARQSMQRSLEIWKDADPDIPEAIAARKLVGPAV